MHTIRIPEASRLQPDKRSLRFEDRVKAAFGPGIVYLNGVDWGHLESEWCYDHWIFRAKTPYGNLWLMLNDPVPSRGHALLALHAPDPLGG